MTLGFRLFWLKEIGRQFGPEPRPENVLSFRSKIDPPLPAVMFGLVTLGSVDPNPAGRVNVDRSYGANLSGPHAGETLQFDHRPNLAGDVGPNRVNERIRDRLDRLRFPDIGSAPTETSNRFEAVMERGRDHFLSDRPLERPENMPHAFVDFAPTETGIDHGLADCLKSQRTKLSSQDVTVEFAKGPESQPNVDRLRCRLAILDVVIVGVP
jgi:hypothetical protein